MTEKSETNDLRDKMICKLDAVFGHDDTAYTALAADNAVGEIISGSSVGLHLDDGKPRVDLLPPAALLKTAEVFDYGARKYGGNNYQKGIAFSRLYASALRHLLARAGGEANDKESGLPHFAHAAANVMMLMELERTKPEWDDLGKDLGKDEG
jgi:hypothetical protein